MSELPAPRMTCHEVVDLLTDYLEHTLDPRAHARVEEHLRTCPDCTADLDQIRVTIGALGRLRKEDVPADVLEELVEAFRDWRR